VARCAGSGRNGRIKAINVNGQLVAYTIKYFCLHHSQLPWQLGLLY
jgi:hypothetical protein